MTISILIDQHTPRIQYATELILKTVLGGEVKLIQKNEIQPTDLIHISYSKNQHENSIHILPHGLLSEKGSQPIHISVGHWKQHKTLFPNTSEKVPFDIFSAAFYLATRYEEYDPNTKRDHHNRFIAKESIAFKENFLHQPLIDIWAIELKNILEDKYRNIQFPNKRFRFICTFDIDNAFAFKHKGIKRQLLSTFRDLVYGRWEHLISRAKTSFGGKDPYDTFDYIKTQCNNIESNVFFLLNSNGKYDRSVDPQKRIISEKIRFCSTFANVGLHPSYEASEDDDQLNKEFKIFETIAGYKANMCRNHYLKLNFPRSYTQLNNRSTKEEHTLGYADEPGFRASICTPYPFYNIESEEQNRLIIVPFIVMDTTLRLYKKLSPVQAKAFINKMIDQVKAVNGTYSMIWHNESLSNQFEWKGWRTVFESTCKQEVK